MLMRKEQHLILVLVIAIATFFSVSCDRMTELSEHQVVFEEDLYLQGTTSAEGFLDLNTEPFWVENKDRIEEITGVTIEYHITRNGSPTDLTANFYFGEYVPNVYLGSAYIAQGATTSGLVTLPLEASQYDLIDLIMTKEAFWYSVQGNSDTADVDFEPVRVTITGTFDIL
ncbi:hypothetical protein JXQ70_19280 [bacterium]|nr:hypothetical protein [bacterium]